MFARWEDVRGSGAASARRIASGSRSTSGGGRPWALIPSLEHLREEGESAPLTPRPCRRPHRSVWWNSGFSCRDLCENIEISCFPRS